MEVSDASLTISKGTVRCVDGSEVLPEDPSAQVQAEFEKKEQRAFLQ